VAAPVVIIEVASPAATPSSTAALVRACDEAVRQGHCELSRPGADPPQPDAIAIVSWQAPAQSHVRVEVGVRQASRTEWAVRELDFRDEDSVTERWRSAGLVIATLVGDLSKKDEAAPRASEAVPAPAPSSATAPTAADSAGRAWVGLGGQAGPAMQEGSWRSGVWVNGAWIVRPTPIYVGLSADFSGRGTDRHGVDAQWLTFGAGVGLFLSTPAKLQAGIELEGIVENFRVQALHPVTRAEARSDGTTPGVRVTLDLSWPNDHWLSAVGGVQWSRLQSGTLVRVADRVVDRSPPWGMKGLVGLRFRLP
jgi:hypothetical protein